jgi:oxygen-independent coproporphyrinogen-3 oxidase
MTTTLALAARNIPRYTSYPTAPHFTAAVGAGRYAEWLSQLDPAAKLSLYLHVPFCTTLCHYCGCNTKATLKREPVEAYADRLLAEIGLIAARTSARHVVHLHWGGGTPSILGTERLRTVVARIAGAFDLSTIAEHAIELDPRQVTPELAQTLAEIGVNRASLGVQDFSPHVQEAIGRIQPFETVAQAVAHLCEAGIEQLNFDLMYGLPRQTLRDVMHSASLAASLKPQRIALFGYAHVPWFKTHQRLIDQADLPGLSERLSQARLAADTLHNLGYEPVGLDHFALPSDPLVIAAQSGRLHRNFQGYTTDEADALLGLGASAIGRLPQGFVQNAPDLAGYARAIDAGTLAAVKGIAFSADDRLRGEIIERLMCDLAVDLDAVTARFGVTDDFAAELEALAPLAHEGLVYIEGRRIAVTERGRLLVRLAAAAFDTYLNAAAARHSLAV